MVDIKFYELVLVLYDLADMEANNTDDHDWSHSECQEVFRLDNSLMELTSQLQPARLDLRLSLIYARGIQKKLSMVLRDPEISVPGGFASEIIKELRVLRDRIKDELLDRKAYYLTTEEAALLEAWKEQFGDEVLVKLPLAKDDLKEAAQCLAFNRPVACVFHLMRAMEIVLLRVGKHLGITIVDRNGKPLMWGVIIERVRDRIAGWKDDDKRRLWDELLLGLTAVKNCWRNPTMHPQRTYTQAEAELVFGAVKDFLKMTAKILPKPRRRARKQSSQRVKIRL